jgi:uncharacterized protein (DUF885 family)
MHRLRNLLCPALLSFLGCEAIRSPDLPPPQVGYPDITERELDRLAGVALELFATVDGAAGTEVGLRAHDGRLGTFLDKEFLARVREADALRDELMRTNASGLDLAGRLDRELLIAALADLSRELGDRRPWRSDPGWALSRLMWCVRSLLRAETVLARERLESLVARMRRMPAALEQARQSLAAPSARLAGRALGTADELAALIREDAERFAAEAGAATSLLQEYQQAAAQALTAVASYRAGLREDVERKGIPEPYAGSTFLLAMLADTMGPEASLAQASIRGEDEVRRLRGAVRDAIVAVDPRADLPAAVARLQAGECPAEAVATVTAELQAFAEQNRLLTWPTLPPSGAAHRLHRFVSEAAMPGGQGTVRATDADSARSAVRWTILRRAQLPLGLLAARMAAIPGRVRMALGSRLMTEGFGEYFEQVLHDAGLWRDDPSANQSFLLGQLLSACRFVTAVRYHQGTMTVDEVAAYFRSEAWLDEGRAQTEALQVAADPYVLAGFAGRMELLELRSELQLRLAASYRIKEFHDRLLAFGAVPFTVARPTLFEELHVASK